MAIAADSLRCESLRSEGQFEFVNVYEGERPDVDWDVYGGGANLRYSKFKVSYAIAVGGVSAIVLIGHNHCGMVNLMALRELLIQGLVDKAGWEKGWAEEHFMHFTAMFEIGNEVDFVLSEAKSLQLRYPKIQVAPLLYRIEDSQLYLIRET